MEIYRKIYEVIALANDANIEVSKIVHEKYKKHSLIIRRLLINGGDGSGFYGKEFPKLVDSVNNLQILILTFSQLSNRYVLLYTRESIDAKKIDKVAKKLSSTGQSIKSAVEKINKLLKLDDYNFIIDIYEKFLSIIKAKTTAKKHKIGGTTYVEENKTKGFFNARKIQFDIWSKALEKNKSKAARKKILDHILYSLEGWTNAKGKGAVIATMNEMLNDKNIFINQVVTVNNYPELLNKQLKYLVKNVSTELCQYYIKHKSKYSDDTDMTHILDGKVIEIKDANLNISVGKVVTPCGINTFSIVCDQIMGALNKIDGAYVRKYCQDLVKLYKKLTKSELAIKAPIIEDKLSNIMDANVFSRRSAKSSIVNLAAELPADCVDIEPLKIEIEHKHADIEMVMKLAKNYLNVGKQARKELKKMESFFNATADHVGELVNNIKYLIGPSVEPCLKRITHCICALVEADLINYYGKKDKINIDISAVAEFLNVPVKFYDGKLKNIEKLVNVIN